MSNTSIKSCGPINCQLAIAKQYLQTGVTASYCKLQKCIDSFTIENTSKSPGELLDVIEYCRPSDCASFWDSFSNNPTPKKSLKENGNKNYLDEKSKLLNHPLCVNSACPKQVNSSNETGGEQKDIQIKLCGPSNCCTSHADMKPNQFKSAQKTRNPIYYCVSPSMYADLDLPSNLSKYQLYAKKETIDSGQRIITCPHVKCCEPQSKPDTLSPIQSAGTNLCKPKPEDNKQNQQLESKSSLKLLNLQNEDPIPKQQAVLNKISTTKHYMNIRNGIAHVDQNTKNGYAQQIEFPEEHHKNMVRSNNCTKNLDCQKCLHENNQLNDCKSKCCPPNCKNGQSVIEKAPNEPCQPNTCEKLLGIVGTKKWKSCCNSKECPINDPTSSTYNFLLRMRMCCGTRQCQLAAKICDIYEPLVEVQPDLSDVGDPQYHYLSQDSSTMVSYSDLEKYVQYKPGKTKFFAEELLEIDEEIERKTNINVITTAEERESCSIQPHKDEDVQKSSRRVSTVSWGIPNFQESHSQEQVISQATAEADKFRQTLDVLQRGSIFGKVVRNTNMSKLSANGTEIDMPIKKSFEKCKSQVSSTIQANDSKTKQRWYSCAALRKKFKTKKNKLPEEQPDSTWKSSTTEYQDKRKMINIRLEPNQGRNQDIHHVLHEI